MAETDVEYTPEQVEQMAAAFAEALDRMTPAERAELQAMAETWLSGELALQANVEALRPYGEAVALQRQASEAFAAADLAVHRAALEAVIPGARAALAEAERVAEQTRDRIAGLRDADAQAAKAAAEADGYLAEQRQAADALIGRQAPALQAAAVQRRMAAQEVADHARRAAQDAALEHEQARRSAVAAQAAAEAVQTALLDAEAALQDAEKTVRPSQWTITCGWPGLLTSGVELTGNELALVRTMIMTCAAQTGADKLIKRQALEQARDERRGEFDQALAMIPAPTSGNIAMPLSAQRDPRGDWRR